MKQDKSIIDQVASECLLGRARKLSRMLTRIYDDELRPKLKCVPQRRVWARRGPICYRSSCRRRALVSVRLASAAVGAPNHRRLRLMRIPMPETHGFVVATQHATEKPDKVKKYEETQCWNCPIFVDCIISDIDYSSFWLKNKRRTKESCSIRLGKTARQGNCSDHP